MNDLIQFFKNSPIFAKLDSISLEELASASHTRHLAKGTILFFEGDPADVLFLIRSGSLAILLTSPDGRELIINEMRPGDCLGELALITDQPRSATAVAREKTEVIILPGKLFLAIMEREPCLMREMLNIIAERLYWSNQRERSLAFRDAPGRLVGILLQLNEQAHDTGYITISQEELARRTGLSRQTVAKSLGRWRRAGWLITGRGKIVLLSIPELERIELQSNY